jgi:hypothetical protein
MYPDDSHGGDEMSYRLSFYEGVGVGVLKIEESESEVLKIQESESELLCTDSTALITCATMCHIIF